MRIQATATQSLHNMFLYMPGFHSGRAAASGPGGCHPNAAAQLRTTRSAPTARRYSTIRHGGSITLNCGIYVNAGMSFSSHTLTATSID